MASRFGSGPFAGVAVALVAAGVVAAAAFAAAVSGTIPGGRWTVVHFVTLGVFTPLIVVFSHHFARSVVHAEAGSPQRLVGAVYAAGVLVALGLPAGQRWVVATGAAAVSVTVAMSYVQLRRMRRGAGATRFAWLIRLYERAHGAFLHGAVLGLLMGVGAISGRWYGAARVAHLHAMVAGWLGVTILATVVFLGPVMLRTRIADGAETRAPRVLRLGVTGLSVATVALVASAAGGAPGLTLRVAAAGGLLLYARAAVTVAVVTVRASRTARPSPARWPLSAASIWFVAAAAADVAVVAAGAWRWLDAVGVLFAVGVAGQLVLSVALYLGPGLRGRTMPARDAMRSRLAWGATSRTLALNAAAVAVTLGAVGDGPSGSLLWRGGWALVAAVVCWIVGALAVPLPGNADPSPD